MLMQKYHILLGTAFLDDCTGIIIVVQTDLGLSQNCDSR